MNNSIAVADGGPIYAETNLDAFPVELWNTVSEAAVLVVAIYWSWKWYNAKPLPLVIKIAALILYPQWLGATLFHALRNSFWWLLLDVIPILLFVVAIAAWGWQRVSVLEHEKLKCVGTTIFAHLLVYLTATLGIFESSIPYAHILVHLASVLYWGAVWGSGSKVTIWYLQGVGAFFVSLVFRELDSIYGAYYGPPGTHFLWHIFAAYAAHAIIMTCYSTVSHGSIPTE